MKITIYGLTRVAFANIMRALSVSWYEDVELDELGEITVILANDTKMYFGNNAISLMLDDDSIAIHRSEYNYIKIE